MIVAGSISDEKEKQEILLVAKTFLIGQRAQELSKNRRTIKKLKKAMLEVEKNEANNKKKSK